MLYKITFLYNPLGRYPARLYPILQKITEKKNSEHYFPKINSDNKIAQFIEASNFSPMWITSATEQRFYSVGDTLPVWFAVSSKNIEEYESFDLMVQSLNLRHSLGQFEKFPSFGLEVARLCNNRDLEFYCCKVIASRLHNFSPKLAMRWLYGAEISEIIRAELVEHFEKFDNMEKSQNSVVISNSCVLQTIDFRSEVYLGQPNGVSVFGTDSLKISLANASRGKLLGRHYEKFIFLLLASKRDLMQILPLLSDIKRLSRSRASFYLFKRERPRKHPHGPFRYEIASTRDAGLWTEFGIKLEYFSTNRMAEEIAFEIIERHRENN
ncbi:hypothetical protein [Salipiger bermudensis]|uniref:hypothetical protein n=1 Tax=Salipiger bermudensis TaxID=344736 RepID=UPI001CD23BDB|nr:hypothetical protein [Salipiger bermudensis]MCA1288604.1 hypothetical protein [Salipiger bermudensis]